jgi:hypothetical protein
MRRQGRVLTWAYRARLVLLHDQDVVRLLFRDKELGVLALGVQRVGGDDAPGQVQRLEQRREPGDLVGLAVHPDLAEHNTTALIEGGQQVYRLAVGAGMTDAPHRLAVHRDTACMPYGTSTPRRCWTVERASKH